MNIPVEFFLTLSALLFFIGVFGFVTRRNLVAMLISVELILNSVDLNFAVMNRILFPGEMEGFFIFMPASPNTRKLSNGRRSIKNA